MKVFQLAAKPHYRPWQEKATKPFARRPIPVVLLNGGSIVALPYAGHSSPVRKSSRSATARPYHHRPRRYPDASEAHLHPGIFAIELDTCDGEKHIAVLKDVSSTP